MKQAAIRPPAAKISLSAPPGDVSGFKRPERTVSPASQPTWNRYIDSRLKQFGTTR